MKILAKLYKYNANTQNKNTGDCVARSISLALGYGDNLRELVDELRSYFNDYQRNGYDF